MEFNWLWSSVTEIAELFLGALGLVAVYATFKAYELAAEDRRPWLSISVQSVDGLVYKGSELTGRFDLRFKNVGRTMAQNVHIQKTSKVVRPEQLAKNQYSNDYNELPPMVILPGETLNVHYRCNLPISEIELVAEQDRSYKIVLLIAVSYIDGRGKPFWTRSAISVYLSDRQSLKLDEIDIKACDLYFRRERADAR